MTTWHGLSVRGDPTKVRRFPSYFFIVRCRPVIGLLEAGRPDRPTLEAHDQSQGIENAPTGSEVFGTSFPNVSSITSKRVSSEIRKCSPHGNDSS